MGTENFRPSADCFPNKKNPPSAGNVLAEKQGGLFAKGIFARNRSVDTGFPLSLALLPSFLSPLSFLSSLCPSIFPLPTASSLGAPSAPQFPTFHSKPRKGTFGAQNFPHDQIFLTDPSATVPRKKKLYARSIQRAQERWCRSGAGQIRTVDPLALGDRRLISHSPPGHAMVKLRGVLGARGIVFL